MGKKSKRPNRASNETKPPSAGAPAPAPDIAYRSDGPSEEEINALQTSSRSLQAKLDQLTDLALANDRANFVNQFVPLDLSEADRAGYLADLTTAEEADGQWRNLVAEIAAIAQGRVNKIEGDQVNNAVFFFQHPLFPDCDREVSFVCTNGEWRAEG